MVSEEIEKSRVGTLGKKYEKGPHQKMGSYEGGLAPASSSGNATGDPSLPCGLDWATVGQQSMHAAQPPEKGDRIQQEQAGAFGLTGPGNSPDGRAMTGHTEPEPAGVKVALLYPSGELLGSCGFSLLQLLLGELPLRSQPTGRRDSRSIFPLPSSRSILEYSFPGLDECEISWLRCVCLSLNSFWGGELDSGVRVSDSQMSCLEGLVKDVSRLCALDLPLENVTWDELFKVRSVDYQGEEVKVAQWFTWENISPALPREIGKVPLSEVGDLGCKYYVDHFESYLKPSTEWVRTKPPRVMVDDAAWPAVCRGLIEANVCCFLEESEVFHVGDAPLLNGLFGVSKDETSADGFEIFRLIMNLIPLNNICRPFSGDVDTLPSWGSMSPFFLQPEENLLVSSEDVKCFFYTMKVPDHWVKFLAFNKPVPDHILPDEIQEGTVYLASRVLPMGFLNSVSLAQHVHRNLVSWSGRDDPILAGACERTRTRVAKGSGLQYVEPLMESVPGQL